MGYSNIFSSKQGFLKIAGTDYFYCVTATNVSNNSCIVE